MKIKKVALALFATGLVLSSSVVSAAGDSGMAATLPTNGGTQGAGGVINFSGEVTTQSCDITPTSKELNVDLGAWAVSYFDNHTETSPSEFSIHVENCPDSVDTVAVLFDGTKDPSNSTLLQLVPGQGNATGLGVKIYNSDQTTAIEPGTVSAAKKKTNNGDANLTFYADLSKTGKEAVGAGHVKAVSNFLMVYN